MLELLFVLMNAVCMVVCFVGGVAATVDELRRTDADLYFEWMRRRDARKERENG